MDLIKNLSTVAGIVGLLICLVSGAVRLTGAYYLGGMEVMTIFDIGVAGMVLGCLLKLEVIGRG